MALCQAFSHNFPYIRTRLTLEYEIEPVNQNQDQSPDRPFHPVSKQSWCPCHRDPLSRTELPGVRTLLLYFSAPPYQKTISNLQQIIQLVLSI